MAPRTCIRTYVHTYICTCIYIFLYIYLVHAHVHMLIHTHTYMPNKGNKTIATVDDTPVSNAITQQKEEESLKGLRNELDNANKASDLLRANVKLLQEKLLTANTKEETSQVDYIFLDHQKVLKVIKLLKSKIFTKKNKKTEITGAYIKT